MPDIQRYLQSLTKTVSTGDTRKENYYGGLNEFLEQHAGGNGHNGVQIIALPSPTDGKDPDFGVWSGADRITGYVEAKLPNGLSLDTIEEIKQLTKYRGTFKSIILTNFVEFCLYRSDEQVAEAEITDPPEIPRFGNAPDVISTDDLDSLLERFFSFPQPEIETARELVTGLAKRTSFMREVALQELGREMAGNDRHILRFYEASEDYLIPDIGR